MEGGSRGGQARPGRAPSRPTAPVLAIECYPGVNYDELRRGLIGPLGPQLALFADDCAQDVRTAQARIRDTVTDDREFGAMSHYRLEDFFEPARLVEAHARLVGATGLTVVYGTGAAPWPRTPTCSSTPT